MKYMLMIYNNPDVAWTGSDEQRRELGELFALRDELIGTGELISSHALADPELTTTVRVRGDVPEVTDGPFAEAKEQLAGYILFECADRERAVEIAARTPPARRYAVELRPIADDAELLSEAILPDRPA